MSGSDYSREAYQISQQFDSVLSSVKEHWQDEQSTRFNYEHCETIRKALYDIQSSIESIVDFADSKLEEIINIEFADF